MKTIKLLLFAAIVAITFTSCDKDEKVTIEKPEIMRVEYEAESWQWEKTNEDKTIIHDAGSAITDYLSKDHMVFVYEEIQDAQLQLPYYVAESVSSLFYYNEDNLAIEKYAPEGYYWTNVQDVDYIVYICERSVLTDIDVQDKKAVANLLSERFPKDSEQLANVSQLD